MTCKLKLLWAGLAVAMVVDAISVFSFIVAASLKSSGKLSEESSLLIIEVSIGGMIVALVCFITLVILLTSTYEKIRESKSVN